MKSLIITEKPSVAMEFAKALNLSGGRKNGYMEDGDVIITWCVGHLVTMSYPEKYDPELKKWDFASLPFLPKRYLYEVIPASKSQYEVVAKLLNRPDVGRIYYAGDSGREGEYIQRLVRALAGRNQKAQEYRVWIDSQTEEEIRRGMREAKPLSFYDNLSESAYARAIEDYGVGINFSRAVTLAYGQQAAALSGVGKGTVAVGRVMSCVLGMVVRREREIRSNVKTKYYPVSASVSGLTCRWKPLKNSPFYKETDLYEGKGFLSRNDAAGFISSIGDSLTLAVLDTAVTKKAAPLLYNLAELQSDCTKLFHIGPDKTLEIAQQLYEKKLTTYPRTDARVLTTAMCRVIRKNVTGLASLPELAGFVGDITARKAWEGLEKTKYVDDSAVTDHYAIIPTGQTQEEAGLGKLERDVYYLICRRFLSIFFPPAEFERVTADFTAKGEHFGMKPERLLSPGWMAAAGKIPDTSEAAGKIRILKGLSRGAAYPAAFQVLEEESQAPKRYTSGSMVLAMENAGKLIEDESLREQIRGSGIGTSATRAETIKKLISIQYIQCSKSQVLSPTLLGETVYETLSISAPSLLSPEMTASWEKGLQGIADGKVTRDVYLSKMYQYISGTVASVRDNRAIQELAERMKKIYPFYKGAPSRAASGNAGASYKCPVCGNPLRKGKQGYFCTAGREKCNFYLWESWHDRKLTDKNIDDLLSGKKTSAIKGFKKKDGGTFTARLKLENGKITPEFVREK